MAQPKTLAYYFFQLRKEPDVIIGVELYSDKSGLREHAEAKSSAVFTKTAGPLLAKPFTLATSSPVCGFLCKENESPASIIENKSAVAVFVTINCKSAEHRTRYLEAARKHCLVSEKESETLSYWWCADLKDLSKLYVFERYASSEGAKTHSSGARQFVRDTKDLLDNASIEVGTPVAGFLKKVDKVAEASNNSSSNVTKVKADAAEPGTRYSPAIDFTQALNGIPQSVAHRGYKAIFPENTLLALEGALKANANGIETDVQISKDNVVVISHDPDTKRCYGIPGLITSKNYHGSEGMSSYLTVDSPRTTMPTLSEVLRMLLQESYHDRWLLLDIKVNNPVRILEHIARTLCEVKDDMAFWARRLVLGIWHHKFMDACALYLPAIPVTHIGLHTSYARRYFLHDTRVQAFNMQLWSLVTKEQQAFVRDAHKLGKTVFVWTVNDQDAMRFCMSLEVDAILSDDPAKTRVVQQDDIRKWSAEVQYWSWSRTMKGYFWNTILYLLMLHRIFWRYRAVKV